MNTFISFILAFFAALSLIFWQVQPVIASDKITIRKENEMGKNFDRLIRRQMSMVEDTYITDYVDSVVQKIVKAKAPMPFRISSAVIANPRLNAFAIPGGYIYIFTGLLEEVTSESQLAGVIAHELGHVSQRHVANRIEKQNKLAPLTLAGMLAGMLLGAVTKGSQGTQAAAAVLVGTQGLTTAAMLNYSQADEREADHVGLNSLVKAGYNPLGMPHMFDIMKKHKWYDTSSKAPSYLSTHPGLTERIGYLNDRISRMPHEFSTRQDENTTLLKVQALVRSKMTPPETALGYYRMKPEANYTPMDYVALGNIYNRLKDLTKAESMFTKAQQHGDKEPLVAREIGIFYFKNGNHDKALHFLQEATDQNKRDALGLFYLARLQAEAKNYTPAALNMQRVLHLVPEDWEVHYHLGLILGESGDIFHGNLHLAYAALYSNDIRKSNYHFDLAQKVAKTAAQKKELETFKKIMEDREKKNG